MSKLFLDMKRKINGLFIILSYSDIYVLCFFVLLCLYPQKTKKKIYKNKILNANNAAACFSGVSNESDRKLRYLNSLKTSFVSLLIF